MAFWSFLYRLLRVIPKNKIVLSYSTAFIGWKHNQLNTKNSLWNCNHIFTHKCKQLQYKILIEILIETIFSMIISSIILFMSNIFSLKATWIQIGFIFDLHNKLSSSKTCNLLVLLLSWKFSKKCNGLVTSCNLPPSITTMGYQIQLYFHSQ